MVTNLHVCHQLRSAGWDWAQFPFELNSVAAPMVYLVMLGLLTVGLSEQTQTTVR